MLNLNFCKFTLAQHFDEIEGKLLPKLISEMLLRETIS